MKTGKSLIELATEIERQKNSKRDLIASTQNIVMNEVGRVEIGKAGTFEVSRNMEEPK